MNANAVHAVIERLNPVLTLGDLVAAVSEVGGDDSAQLLTALFTSGRARFVDPGALDRLSRPLPPMHSARAPRARTRSVSRRRASRAG